VLKATCLYNLKLNILFTKFLPVWKTWKPHDFYRCSTKYKTARISRDRAPRRTSKSSEIDRHEHKQSTIGGETSLCISCVDSSREGLFCVAQNYRFTFCSATSIFVVVARLFSNCLSCMSLLMTLYFVITYIISSDTCILFLGLLQYV
jgi:Flp pilus assembly protein TadB